MYTQTMENKLRRFDEYWAMENHDTPLLRITGRKEKKVADLQNSPDTIQEKWLDINYRVASCLAGIRNTYWGGDCIPAMDPNLGPDILGATLGCELKFEQTTSYAVPYVEDWDELPVLRFNPENKWWKKLTELTEAMTEAAHGEYPVNITDLHPGFDGLVSLRGPENLCIDMIEQPDMLARRSMEIFEVFKTEFNELCDLTQRYGGGTTNWMGIYHPQRWYVTSCDFSCMISPQNYRDYILPEIVEEARMLGGRTIYHLDGPQALRHLPALLEVPEIAGIQWVYGAGQPSAAHWIDVLKKIQGAGKRIQIVITPEDVPALAENIAPEGVMYLVEGSYTESEAKAIENLIADAYRTRRKL